MNLRKVLTCQGSVAYCTKTRTSKPTVSKGVVPPQVSRHVGLWFFLTAVLKTICFPYSLRRMKKNFPAPLRREKGTSRLHSEAVGLLQEAWIYLGFLEMLSIVEGWCPVRCSNERKAELALEFTPYQIKGPATRNYSVAYKFFINL